MFLRSLMRIINEPKKLEIMKILIALSLFTTFSINAQIYERTRKNIGVYVGSNMSFVSSDRITVNEMTYSVSGGLVHMILPGIYPKLGYHYMKMPAGLRNNSNIIMSDLHSIEGSVLFDKNLFKFSKGVRVIGSCHYLSIGLILAPEYRYTFSGRNQTNVSTGEVSILAGFSFTHIHKSMSRKNKSRTTQFDLFARKGLTPFYMLNLAGKDQKFTRFEIGISIRKIKHQVYNFLPN
jgi:hypothetical protein